MKHYLAFNHRWFAQHQRIIVFVLNAFILGTITRKMLHICDKREIVFITPSSYAVRQGGECVAEFRTHWKYAKRMYHSMKFVWWAMHFWDLFAPQKLSFGFSTLTVRPDPDPENTTVDGVLTRSDAAGVPWSDLVTGTGTDANDTASPIEVIRATDKLGVNNQFTELRRAIFLFDTSSLGGGALISSAVFSVMIQDKANNYTVDSQLTVVSSNPASNTALATGDYTTFGTTDFITHIDFSNLVANGNYQDMTLNAAGIAAIAKTGITKLGIRERRWDVANDAPPWTGTASHFVSVYSADEADTSSDPKLVITYTPFVSRVVII